MTRIDELKKQLKEVRNEIVALKAEGKVDEALLKVKEVENIKFEIEVEEALEDKTPTNVINRAKREEVKEIANELRVAIKAMHKHQLSEDETEIANKLEIKRDRRNSISGVEYTMPHLVMTQVKEFIRTSVSLKNYLGYINTNGCIAGSFPVDKTDNDDSALSTFVPVVDGTPMVDSNNLTLELVQYSLKKVGTLLILPNTALDFSDVDLVALVSKMIARRALNFYNAEGFKALKEGKTVKALTDLKGLIKVSNTVLDSLAKASGIIITNQDGVQKLIEKEDGRGISYIQHDLTKAPILTINSIPVVEFPNKQLMSRVAGAETFAPIFMGNLREAVSFVDDGRDYEISSEAIFLNNVFATKAIAYADTVSVDKSDENYVYGEIKVTV